jgi:hypothetical protein
VKRGSDEALDFLSALPIFDFQLTGLRICFGGKGLRVDYFPVAILSSIVLMIRIVFSNSLFDGLGSMADVITIC